MLCRRFIVSLSIFATGSLFAEGTTSLRNFTFLPSKPCVLNYILFPAPQGWYFNYAESDGNHTFVFMRPKPVQDVSIFVRFTDDPTGSRFDEAQKTMTDLTHSANTGVEKLDATALDAAAEKGDIFFIPKPNGDDFFVIYKYKDHKDFFQMIISFDRSFSTPPLSPSESKQFRSLALDFIRQVRKIEVLRTPLGSK